MKVPQIQAMTIKQFSESADDLFFNASSNQPNFAGTLEQEIRCEQDGNSGRMTKARTLMTARYYLDRGAD